MFLSFSFISHWMYSCKSHFGKLPSCKCIQGHLFLMRSYIIQIYSCFSCCCCCLKSQQQTLMQLSEELCGRQGRNIKSNKSVQFQLEASSVRVRSQQRGTSELLRSQRVDFPNWASYLYIFIYFKKSTKLGMVGGTLESSLVLFFKILPCHPNIIVLG